MNKKYFCIFIVFLIAISMHFVFLNRVYWVDEVNTIFYVQNSWAKLTELVANDFSPPLYYYLLKIWILFFRGSTVEWITRLFSVILNLLVLPVMYLLGKEASSKRVGLISTLMLAFSFYYIYYSWETRMYALTMLFSLLSVLFLVRSLKYARKIDWFLYFIWTVGGVYTHYSFWFLLLGENIALVVFLVLRSYKPQMFVVGWLSKGVQQINLMRKWIWLQTGILLIYIPWWPYFLERIYFTQIFNHFYWTDLVGANPKFFLENLFLEYLISPFETKFLLLVLAKLITITLIFLSFFKIKYFDNHVVISHRNDLFIPFFVILYLVPVSVLFFFNIFIIRYSLIVLPLFFLLLAFGLSRIERDNVRLIILSIVLLLMFVADCNAIQTLQENEAEHHWDQAAKFITQHESLNEDEIIIIPSTLNRRAFAFYYNGALPIKELFPSRFLTTGQDEEVIKTRYIGLPLIESKADVRELDIFLKPYKTVWYVCIGLDSNIADFYGLFAEWLNDTFQPTDIQLKFNAFPGLYIRKYNRRGSYF